MKVKVDDVVEVIAGNDRGTQGKVLSVNHQTGRVIVEGVNRVYKHVRRSNRNPQGGRLSKETPLPASNVMVVDSDGTPTRIGYRVDEESGKRVRISKRNGKDISS